MKVLGQWARTRRTRQPDLGEKGPLPSRPRLPQPRTEEDARDGAGEVPKGWR